MKRTLYTLFLFISFFSCHPSFSQGSYPKHYLKPLFDIPLSLSGNFGQLRPDHYHSGIDLKTGLVEGMPVISVEDGYVSRIKVSAYGFGKVVYITHPGHYVSVYGHLKGYYGKIKDYVTKYQADNETFEFDVQLDSSVLRVKRGDIIALSGNSGTSSGPHLHFELREEQSEEPVNPLLFGYQVEDTVKPVISAVRIIPVGQGSAVKLSALPLNLEVLKTARVKAAKGKKKTLPVNDTIAVKGKLKFGIEAYDLANGSRSKLALYHTTLMIDSEVVFSKRMDKFSYTWKRAINSEIDYSYYLSKKRRFECTSVVPGDHSGLIDTAINNGVFSITDGKVHRLQYRVSDFNGNCRDYRFYLRWEAGSPNDMIHKKQPGETWFACNVPNHFEKKDFMLDMPAGVLYDSIAFRYSASMPLKGIYSAVHHVHSAQVPLNDYYSLSIRPLNLPARLHDKVVIVKVAGEGRYKPAGGEWDNGYLKTRVQEFGNYAITADTAAPSIRAGNFKPGKKIPHPDCIRVRIADDLSGVESFYPMVNGKWVLMDYDGKTRSLTYTLGAEMEEGENLFCLSVWDRKGNTRFFSAVFLLDEKGLKQVR